MGFKINVEQKIRIPLSMKSQLVIAEDMDVFGVTSKSSFINTVFENYRSDAKSSLSLYLQMRKSELNQLFAGTALSEKYRQIAVNQLLKKEKESLNSRLDEYSTNKYGGQLYRINNKNTDYLSYHCSEDTFYKGPGQYVGAVLDEYCSLPFIEREQIYRRSLFEEIAMACEKQTILEVTVPYLNKEQVFFVYPYKIVPDTFHTQSYLICYSHMKEEDANNRIIASFSMARLQEPIKRRKFHLNKSEIHMIEERLLKYSPAYFVGKPEQIQIRLTEDGKRTYQSKFFSRPTKIEELSTEDIYVFNCSQLQIYNYFLPFGSNAEIIAPDSLRERFSRTYSAAAAVYQCQHK